MEKKISVDIRKLDKENLPEFIELIHLFEVVFEMEDFSMPNTHHLQKLLNQNNFGVFVATFNGKVVGGLTTYVLEQYYSEKPLAYIFDLAVDNELQRKGIGKKLIATVNKFYQEKGFEEVFVQADKVDDYAIDFYRKTSPSAEEEVAHFYYKLN
ncbi:MAG: GNAT family N-acetyltransferase [Flammeovirgaceae bacterium]